MQIKIDRYSLVGAKCCGKTTVLSCILGKSQLQKGNIFVFGKRLWPNGSGISANLLGYTPQVHIYNILHNNVQKIIIKNLTV